MALTPRTPRMAVAIATTNFKTNMTTDFFIINEAKEHFQTNHAKHGEDDNTNNLNKKVKINYNHLNYNQTKSRIYFHEDGKYMKKRYNLSIQKGYNCSLFHQINKR